MDVLQATPGASVISEPIAQKPDRFSVTVSKPIPHNFDLGNLLLNDFNPLPPSPSPALLASTARECAQSLINQLLTTCPISTTSSSDVLMTLPPSTTPLPREKPLPAEKKATKWEKFAAKKGIKDKKRGEGKMVFDEDKGEWVPKWGYKGRNKEGEGEWIVEVDEKKEKERQEEGTGKTVRGEGRRERKEKVRRGERKQRANDRRGRKGAAGV
ncbi:Rhodanese- sulfurtransferase [Mycoblastus sanguinarius]|nr:Rhodanese- sulfurtransferase [Mycoblastus sanguinarius]